MHPYPHVYEATASGAVSGPVTVASRDLPPIESAPPPQFDGPAGNWSPETLLCAAVVDCFVLTFRGLSRAARFEWSDLKCRVEGTLERRDGVAQFTRFVTHATLTVPEGTEVSRARSLLERAEHSCLIANSLRGARVLEVAIIAVPGSAHAAA
jgi:organic hydroperoxide reductase OsmC/OhrA